MTDWHAVDGYVSGRWHIPCSDAAEEKKQTTVALLKQFNDLANTDPERGADILRELLPADSAVPQIFAPFNVEYGFNTRFGEGCFLNYNCVILDTVEVTIGARALFGPGCQIISVEHPVGDLEMRRIGFERGHAVRIGDDCWFGAGAMVMPGVTIGNRCVIASGAVITKDIPDDSLVAGVPAEVKRKLNQPGDYRERAELPDAEDRQRVEKQ
ncbi:sugar O-acetyltransferase [Corynebacterium glucuronolyticum]|uniref:Sugar O-acetyltransferase n=2 Tax=Corynebacterium glucuronolyticum TaxID=39791 RepID=A0A7T4EE38_9CORY|nr:sugar O-acetyltransferase [Corynebacterium glucuronolyticum]QQB45700.1 sugar O-acetyltransferase [Corynebacterium glucuronolyticum]WKD63623.1 Putative acetyltransferase [Corynebacterium glucuronolyticum DSM 44120]SMB81022.1 maltose O-acetyltransferase [Corynebacterium glucuronolyticum]